MIPYEELAAENARLLGIIKALKDENARLKALSPAGAKPEDSVEEVIRTKGLYDKQQDEAYERLGREGGISCRNGGTE